MKKYFWLIPLIITLVACGGKNKSADNQDKSIFNAPNSPAGLTYISVFPVDNIKLETYVTFRADGTAKLETRPIDSDTIPTYINGKWSLSDTLISAVFNTKTYNFVINQKNKIYYLKHFDTKNQRKITFNAVKQMTKEQVEGAYYKYKANKVHYDMLTLNNVGGDNYEVRFESTGASKGCQFYGKGNLIYNRIYINLAEINKDLKSKLTITIRDNRAYVFTEDAKDVSDLVKFCSNGRTMTGNYEKK